MHNLIGTLLPIALSLLVTPLGATDCDIIVSLFDYSGKPTDARVSLVDATGSEAAFTNSVNGVAELCDAGVRPVTIVVGNDSCGRVSIHRIEANRYETKRVPVYYQNCHSFGIDTGCSIVLRVRDKDGRPMAGASVKFGRVVEKSDRLGRIHLSLLYGSSGEATVSKPGFRDNHLAVECSRGRERFEAGVKLERE